MKKIMIAMLGFALLTGTVAFSADKDTTKSTSKSKTHKGGKKKSTAKKTTA